mgnify:CR=1 FL=1
MVSRFPGGNGRPHEPIGGRSWRPCLRSSNPDPRQDEEYVRYPILEEANIDSWLTHFQQQGQYDNIQDWRQRIEDEQARSGHRPPRLIKVAEAVKDFRHALLTDAQYSKSATALLRTLNRPKPHIVELWRLQNQANRPAALTPEQQAYVEKTDKREQVQRRRTEGDLNNLPDSLWKDAEKLYSQAMSATLSIKLKYRRQARVLEDISEWLYQHQDENAHLAQLLGTTKEEDEKSAGKIFNDLGKLVMRAARVGLLYHPYINRFVELQRHTYNRSLLTKAKMGLGARFPKPIEARQLEIERMSERGLSLQQIANKLTILQLNPEGKTLGKKGIHKRLRSSRRK